MVRGGGRLAGRGASAAVLAARARRVAGKGASEARIEWFIAEVAEKLAITMRRRVEMATFMVKDKVVQNISRPVTKTKGSKSGRIVVTNRSKGGEFPKADTTQLMKGIFAGVRQVSKGNFEGFVGTPLDYGAILETNKRLNRSFLVRTLREEQSKVNRILTGPIK